jgi:hypothetical protein
LQACDIGFGSSLSIIHAKRPVAIFLRIDGGVLCEKIYEVPIDFLPCASRIPQLSRRLIAVEDEEGMPLGLPDPKEMRFYLSLAQVGTEMVGPLLVGLLLDWLLGWLPWATVVGAVLGFVGGMMHMISMLSAHQREEEQRKKRP